MNKVLNQKHYEAQESRVAVDFITDHGQYHAVQWQSTLEMIYLLNGNAQIVLDGEAVSLVQGEFIVIDSNRFFEFQCKESFMQICVHVDKEFLSMRAGQPEDERQISRMYLCKREDLTQEQLTPYLETCELFKQLVPLYINEPSGYRLKSESIILDILYLLVQHFSVPLYEEDLVETSQDQLRIRQILEYVESHYAEPLSLAQIAGEFGLSREYFSRLFHKKLGLTLSQHLNRVRIAHFYHDLITEDAPVMELLEKHGLTNYKLFSRTFKEIYGYTPREIRRRFT